MSSLGSVFRGASPIRSSANPRQTDDFSRSTEGESFAAFPRQTRRRQRKHRDSPRISTERASLPIFSSKRKTRARLLFRLVTRKINGGGAFLKPLSIKSYVVESFLSFSSRPPKRAFLRGIFGPRSNPMVRDFPLSAARFLGIANDDHGLLA